MAIGDLALQEKSGGSGAALPRKDRSYLNERFLPSVIRALRLKYSGFSRINLGFFCLGGKANRMLLLLEPVTRR
jgi:hypothetical protein